MNDIVNEFKIIVKNKNIQIKDKINIENMNNFITSIENNRPIPIIFYNKILVEIKNNKIKCIKCSKIGQYKCCDDVYCWIHAHSL
jgi:Rps23 Pro-64 3,4-dihydroxylase Tpa1-like proline 4-hydroxylase